MTEAIAVNVVCIAVVAANGIFVMYRWAPRLLSPYLQLACAGALMFSTGNLASNLTVGSAQMYWYALLLLYTGLFLSVCCWMFVAVRMAEHHGAHIRVSIRVWRDLPAAALGLFWLSAVTNPWHGLFLTPVPGERSIYGPLWYGGALTSWLIVAFTVIFCSYRAIRANYSDDRWQMAVCACAMATPTLLNLTYTASATPPDYDPTIVGFAIVTSLFVLAVYRGQIYGATGLRLEDAIENDSRPGILVDQHMRMIHTNQAARELFDIPQNRQLVLPLLARGLLDRFGEPAHEQDLLSSEAVFRLRSDPDSWLSIERRPIRLGRHDVGSALFVRDESARVRVDEALQEARKFESLGLIAGGIAHDFNNLLVSVIGNAELAQLKVYDDPAAAHELLERISQAGQRGADLAKQLLTYAGKANIEPTPVHLNDTVTELARMLRSSMRSEVALQLELDPEEPVAQADSSQVTQVLLNLIVNAEEALAANGGAVTVSTGSVRLNQADLADRMFRDGAVPGDYVTLTVSDNGPGVDDATLVKMFDPFFSTKSVGRGLGLAATLGTLRSHRGALDVETSPGAGTSITAYLPANRTCRREASGTPQLTGEFSRKSVLVIDDDQAVRRVHRQMLESLGFDVQEAPNGQEALQTPVEVDLVLVDQTMPGMSGSAVARKLRAERPDLPIVLVSGYSETFLDNLPEGTRFLRKPFTTQNLAYAVQEAIGAQS